MVTLLRRIPMRRLTGAGAWRGMITNPPNACCCRASWLRSRCSTSCRCKRVSSSSAALRTKRGGA